MMKILIVNTHLFDAVGGSEVQCEIIARGLQARGHEVLYFAVKGKKHPPRQYHTSYAVWPSALTPEALKEALRDFKPDIVYWRSNKKHLLESARIIKEFDTPIVFAASHISDVKHWHVREKILVNSIRNLKSALFTLRQTIRNQYNHRALRIIDGLVVNNADFLHISDVSRQVFIPNSAEDKVVPFSWPRPFCVWVSQIKGRKNPEQYVELARRMQDSGIDFLMVGAIQAPKYEWIQNSNRTPKNFYYLGAKSLEEVNGILKESLFLVHTCEPEGFPNVFIQTWMQGKPVVSLYFDPCGYIEDKALGFVSGGMGAFARDAETLLHDANRRIAIGERARMFAGDMFDPEKNTGILERFLFRIVASPEVDNN